MSTKYKKLGVKKIEKMWGPEAPVVLCTIVEAVERLHDLAEVLVLLALAHLVPEEHSVQNDNQTE